MNNLPKLVIWATLSAILFVCIFPKPQRYSWESWGATTVGKPWEIHYELGDWSTMPNQRSEDRQFIFDLELYGRIRPNFVRIAVEVFALALVGGGLAFSLRRSGSS